MNIGIGNVARPVDLPEQVHKAIRQYEREKGSWHNRRPVFSSVMGVLVIVAALSFAAAMSAWGTSSIDRGDVLALLLAWCAFSVILFLGLVLACKCFGIPAEEGRATDELLERIADDACIPAAYKLKVGLALKAGDGEGITHYHLLQLARDLQDRAHKSVTRQGNGFRKLVQIAEKTHE